MSTRNRTAAKSTPGPPERGTRSPRPSTQSRRAAILAAAERLFAERGYERTSMKEIAGAVGITDAALYRHFDSKRDLLEVVYDERGFFRAMEQLEHLPGSLPMAEQFRLNVLASVQLWADNADFLRVIFTGAMVGDTMALDVHRVLMDRWRRGIERLYSIYAERGEAEAGLAEPFARATVSMLFGALMEVLLESRPGDGGGQFADRAFLDSVTRGIGLLVAARRVGPALPGG